VAQVLAPATGGMVIRNGGFTIGRRPS
jgi:hypothetical protein